MSIEYEVQERVWIKQINRNPRLRRVEVWKTFLIGFNLETITRGFLNNPNYRVIYRDSKKPIPRDIIERLL